MSDTQPDQAGASTLPRLAGDEFALDLTYYNDVLQIETERLFTKPSETMIKVMEFGQGGNIQILICAPANRLVDAPMQINHLRLGKISSSTWIRHSSREQEPCKRVLAPNCD